MLLGAPGLTSRNKKLLGAPGLASRTKDATTGAAFHPPNTVFSNPRADRPGRLPRVSCTASQRFLVPSFGNQKPSIRDGLQPNNDGLQPSSFLLLVVRSY